MRLGKNLAVFLFLMLLCKSIVCADDMIAQNMILLENMQIISSNCYELKDEMIDSYGNEHDSNIAFFDASVDACVIYNLDGRYEKFSGSIVTPNETDSGAEINFTVWGDGILLYDKRGITRQSSEEDFCINVTGVKEMEIKASNVGGNYYGYICVLNGSFELSDKQIETVKTSRLRDTVLVDSYMLEEKSELVEDRYGNIHNGCYEFLTAEENTAVFNLAKKYDHFSGTIIPNAIAYDTEVSVAIYLDDQLAFSQEGVVEQTEPMQFDLDVTNITTVMFIITQTKGVDYWDVSIVDDLLQSHKHTPGEWKITREATCAEEGLKVRLCTLCGEKCDEERIETLAHQPDGKYVITEEASCEKEGREAQHCLICGGECEEKEIARLEHVPEKEWTVLEEPTCQNEGKKVRYCSTCLMILETEEIPKIDHEPSDWVESQPATCETSGTNILYCKMCGEVLDVATIKAKGHHYGPWTAIRGSIWNSPIEKQRICSVCLVRDNKKNYFFVWVKPVVIIICLALLGYILMRLKKRNLHI